MLVDLSEHNARISWTMFTFASGRINENIFYMLITITKIYILYIIVTKENRLEAKVNGFQFQKN